jgi:hypothetical protein
MQPMAPPPTRERNAPASLDLQNLALPWLPWPTVLLALATTGCAVWMGGAGGIRAFVFGWLFAGAAWELGHVHVVSVLIGAARTERDAARQSICWADVRSLVVSLRRRRHRRVRLTFQDVDNRVATRILVCDTEQSSDLLAAARQAGAVPAPWLVLPPWHELRAVGIHTMAGSLVYGGAGLMAGRGLAIAALSALSFAFAAAAGGIATAMIEQPSARATAGLFSAAGAFTFPHPASRTQVPE